MAVQGAHLTTTAADLTDAPSIFEVLAQESLLLSMKPALQHLLRVVTERNPARYGRLYSHSDEVYLILQLILERHYLKHYSSSFSENFYGMKRVWTSTITSNEHNDITSHTSQGNNTGDTTSHMLQGKNTGETTSTLYNTLPLVNRHKSLIFLVLVPYLKNKCDVYYEKLSKQPTSHSNQHEATTMGIKKQLCRAFLAMYPILHMVWESTMLSTQMAYIFNKSRVHSPFLHWAGVVLCNLIEEDYNGGEQSQTLSLHDKSWGERLMAVSSRLLSGLAVGLSTGLSVGVFFLQFLEWWYTSDQKATSLTAMPNPPPPQPLTSVAVPQLHTLCPLCQRVRTNDTALAVSGFVFCYSCVRRYVTENGCCPVTKYPANTDHLIRLYLPDS